MIYFNKTINLTIFHLSIILIFIILNIFLFIKKYYNLIIKINKYKKIINQLKNNNLLLYHDNNNIKNTNINIGNHNSSHSNQLNASWLN